MLIVRKFDDLIDLNIMIANLASYLHCSPLDITIPGLSVDEETFVRDQLKLLPALSPAMIVR